MTPTLVIGPLVLPAPLLLALGALWLGLLLGSWAARRADAATLIARPLNQLLLVTLLAARLGFVWPYRDAYLSEPWSLLDLRDGGWNAQAGIVAAWIYTLVLLRRQPLLRRPLLWAVGAASSLWIVGSVLLRVLPDEAPRLPAIELQTLDGASRSLQDFAGRPTVVNLWATWCPPCRREMPVLAQAQQRHPGVNFVFLNQGERAETVQAYLRGSGLSLQNVLLDRKGAAGAAYSTALPTTLFFDADGRLVAHRIGELSTASLGEHMAALGARESAR